MVVTRFALNAAITVLAVGCTERDKVLAAGAADAELLGATNGRVYWRQDDAVYLVDDGMDEPLSLRVVGSDWMRRGNAALDARGVYYSHHNKITYLELDGPPETGERQRGWVRGVGGHPTGAAIDGPCVYSLHVDVECRDRGAVLAVPTIEGAACAGRPVPANGLQGGELALDHDHFYWVDSSCPDGGTPTGRGLKALPRRGGAVVAVAPDETSMLHDVQVGARGVYWRTDDAVRVSAKSAAGFEAPVALATGAIRDLVVDRGSVFYVTGESLYWFREGAAQPRLVADKPRIRALVVDQRFLYWLTSGGLLKRSRRPD
jgi:hypothetical protein